MINKTELLFAVDENNQPIEPVERQKAHAEGVWHRTTDIAVVNSDREILCHKRSVLKDTGPGLWDSCFGGHIGPGVESVKGAIQELKEESGLDPNENDLKFLGIIQHVSENEKNKEFRYFYIYIWNGKSEDIKFEKDEISEVKWVGVEILKKEIIDKNEWSPAPHFDKLLDYFSGS